eukprot:Opistho-2@88246
MSAMADGPEVWAFDSDEEDAGSPCLLDIPDDTSPNGASTSDALDRIVHESLGYYLDCIFGDEKSAPLKIDANTVVCSESAKEPPSSIISLRSFCGAVVDDAVSLECLASMSGSIVTVVFGVLQFSPCHTVVLRKTSESVPVASLLVGDNTKGYVRIVLWRSAAAWVERLSPGCVVRAAGVLVRTWRGAISCSSTSRTCLSLLYDPRVHGRPSHFLTQRPSPRVRLIIEWLLAVHAHCFAAVDGVPAFSADNRGGRVTGAGPHSPFVAMTCMRDGVICSLLPCHALAASSSAVLLGDGRGSSVLLRLAPAESHWVATVASRPRSAVWEVRDVLPRQTRHGTTIVLVTTCTSQLFARQGKGKDVNVCIMSEPRCYGTLCDVGGQTTMVSARIMAIEFLSPSGGIALRISGSTGCPSTTDIRNYAVYIGCSRCRLPSTPDASGIHMPCVRCIRDACHAGKPNGGCSWMYRPARAILASRDIVAQQPPEGDHISPFADNGASLLRRGELVVELTAAALQSLLCGLPATMAAVRTLREQPFALVGTADGAAERLVVEALWRCVRSSCVTFDLSVRISRDENGYRVDESAVALHAWIL